ncbi:MAG: hypothetical protein KBD63_04085 [Bacteriovoracaceae bacterium]|nr:hypothetical protein [Bacteriovoracaceae bacterium]
MKYPFFAVSLFLSITIRAQVYVQNNSLEGLAPSLNSAPAFWTKCSPGTPDIQPGLHNVTLPAHDGASYAGLIHDFSLNNRKETISAQLLSPLVVGQSYTMNLALVDFKNIDPNWNVSGYLEIWGGSTPCDFSELLWISPQITNTNFWQLYNATFTPSSATTHISLRASTPTGWCSLGVDKMDDSPILAEYPLQAWITREQKKVFLHIEFLPLEEGDEILIEKSSLLDLDFTLLEKVTEPLSPLLLEDFEGAQEDSIYRISLLDQNGRVKNSLLKTLRQDTDSFFKLTPNPLQQNSFLKMETLIKKAGPAQIWIRDALGSLIYSEKFYAEVGVLRKEIKMDFPSGSYSLIFNSIDQNSHSIFSVL